MHQRQAVEVAGAGEAQHCAYTMTGGSHQTGPWWHLAVTLAGHAMFLLSHTVILGDSLSPPAFSALGAVPASVQTGICTYFAGVYIPYSSTAKQHAMSHHHAYPPPNLPCR